MAVGHSEARYEIVRIVCLSRLVDEGIISYPHMALNAEWEGSCQAGLKTYTSQKQSLVFVVEIVTNGHVYVPLVW